MNFSRSTLNSSESNQPLRDPRKITFVMLNRFWSLSKIPLAPTPILLVFNEINRLHGIPSKIKWKILACFNCFSSFEKVLLWKVIRCSCQFLYFFVSNVPFLRDSNSKPPPPPPPFNGQNLLNMTNVFLSIFLKMSSEILFFFFKFINKILHKKVIDKAFFLKVPATDSLVFFSEHNLRTAILTQGLVITCK